MLKKIIIIASALLLIAVGYGLYKYFEPHRNVQEAEVFVSIKSTDLANEFLQNTDQANKKYLAADGESKVVVVTGSIHSIETDQKGQKVVLLKPETENVGVSCTFMESTNKNAEALKTGQQIAIKGVIRSGAEYDEDLDLYEDVIIENCDVVK